MIFFADVISQDGIHTFEWPTTFLKIPVVGDYILSNCGSKRAKVISICHYINEQHEARVYIEIKTEGL